MYLCKVQNNRGDFSGEGFRGRTRREAGRLAMAQRFNSPATEMIRSARSRSPWVTDSEVK